MQTILKKGEHLPLKCSACRKPIADVWMRNPDEPGSFTFVAECPYCVTKSGLPERSFPVYIKGGVGVGGYGLPDKDDPDNVFPVTDMVDFQTDDSLTVIKVKVHA